MPATKRENFYFGMMMCIGMVIFMTTYNLIRNDLMGTISVTGMLMQFVLGFIVAFILELFVVGPVAKKIAFSLPYDKSKKALVIVAVAFCMVSGMVLCMSLFGLMMAYFADQLDGVTLLQGYISNVWHNYIFAFPLQLIVMGPLVRFLFVKFVKNKLAAEPAVR